MKKISKLAALTILLSSCSAGEMVGKWNVINLYDEFTESKTCRIEYGNPLQKSFLKGFTGQYFTYHFYAENKDGEVRAGIRSEPQIAISGDVQIKIGDELITLTSEDAPLDTTPTPPKFNMGITSAITKSMTEMTNNMTKSVYKMASPYRAFTGKKAKRLLSDVINYKGEIKFRTVGINSATSGTGRFKADKDFENALKRCEIEI